MNMPEHICYGANTSGQNLQILKLLNVMVTSFYIEGGGGGVVRLVRLKCTQACPWDNSVLCSNEESSHISAGTNCDATEPSC